MAADTAARRAYSTPLPTAREITARWSGTRRKLSLGDGKWADRNWLNVPGAFYTGVTDNGGNGEFYAPDLVLCGRDLGMEFIHRQPQTPVEIEALLRVAWDEPFGGYAWDGDEHWTEASVREWWADRARVRAWITGQIAERSISSSDYDRKTVPALHGFAAYVDGPLERYLRGYLYWLDRRRDPPIGAMLPQL